MGDAANDTASRPRILVVEDEFLIGEMVAEVLTEHGCEVHVVTTALDALRHLTSGAICDVLFTDINLPGSIDGALLSQLVRNLRPDLPVVYASGRVMGLEQLNAVPGATFVPKPYDPVRLCRMLQSCAASRH